MTSAGATGGIAPAGASTAHMDELRSQAALWWTRLDAAPADAALGAAFEAWLALDPAHRLAYAEVAELGYALQQLEPELPATPALRPRRSLLAWLGRGAAATLLLAWGWLLLPGWWQDWRADAATGTGQVLRQVLADGSVLTLDGDSAVIVRYAAQGRELELLRGALHVEVRPDPARPLRVRAGERSATALGTAFSVDHDSGEVVVDHGRVRVEDGAARAEVGAGQAALPTATAAAGWMLRTVSSGAPDWNGGAPRLFDRAPLRQVLQVLDRHLPGRLWLRPHPALDQPVTALLDLHDPARALAQLCAAHGLRAHWWPGVVVVGAQ